MPMAVRYTTVDGQIVCENRGGIKTLFMPDTLGNVIETRNMDTGAQTSSTTYWPYGEVRTQTGTNPSPFGFCGVWGYYTQAGQPTYVRARYYRPNLGRWQTVDPLWPAEPLYSYAYLLPTMIFDPTGAKPWSTCEEDWCFWQQLVEGKTMVGACMKCAKSNPYTRCMGLPSKRLSPEQRKQLEAFLSWFNQNCGICGSSITVELCCVAFSCDVGQTNARTGLTGEADGATFGFKIWKDCYAPCDDSMSRENATPTDILKLIEGCLKRDFGPEAVLVEGLKLL